MLTRVAVASVLLLLACLGKVDAAGWRDSQASTGSQVPGARTKPTVPDTPACRPFASDRTMVVLIAVSPHPLSPRTLDQRLNDKRLADLTERDLQRVAATWIACWPHRPESARAYSEIFVSRVFEAQDTRNRTLIWIAAAIELVGQLPATRDSVVRLHAMYDEVQDKSAYLAPSDLHGISDAISQRLHAIYAAMPRPIPISR
jgi:hypothetical protein